MHPRVTVICICYNQGKFVEQAIMSVINQTYKNIQLILIDNGSADNSLEQINNTLTYFPDVMLIALPENIGNCKAFNLGLHHAQGTLVIDLAADDVLVAERVARQVEIFETLGEDYGVVFTDATYIDEQGAVMHHHVDDLRLRGMVSTVPQGDIYTDVIYRYFISSPTMMIRRSVLDALQGYDEALAYEDYDFWVRSSRFVKYAFIDERLTLVRRAANSMSTGWYQPGDRQLHSTYLICRKIVDMNRTQEERDALLHRVRYELRQSVFSKNCEEAKLFYQLLRELNAVKLMDRILMLIHDLPLPFSTIRSVLR